MPPHVPGLHQRAHANPAVDVVRERRPVDLERPADPPHEGAHAEARRIMAELAGPHWYRDIRVPLIQLSGLPQRHKKTRVLHARARPPLAGHGHGLVRLRGVARVHERHHGNHESLEELHESLRHGPDLVDGGRIVTVQIRGPHDEGPNVIEQPQVPARRRRELAHVERVEPTECHPLECAGPEAQVHEEHAVARVQPEHPGVIVWRPGVVRLRVGGGPSPLPLLP